MPTIIGGGEEIQPIEWEQYVGETVNTNLIIRKGKKIQNGDFIG